MVIKYLLKVADSISLDSLLSDKFETIQDDKAKERAYKKYMKSQEKNIETMLGVPKKRIRKEYKPFSLEKVDRNKHTKGDVYSYLRAIGKYRKED